MTKETNKQIITAQLQINKYVGPEILFNYNI